MLDLSPKPGDLEPIETASRDEIEALQLERLQWSLRHAYDNVAFYRASFDAAGVRPEDLKVFAPHQANMRITDAMFKALKLPAEVVVARDIAYQGNTSAASIPLAVEALLESGEAKSGDTCLIIGFGAGLVYAGQVIVLP